MEIIWIGVLLFIGFVLAPYIIVGVTWLLAVVFLTIVALIQWAINLFK